MDNDFFKILGIIGMLSAQISQAAADGQITVEEAMNIVKMVCQVLNIEVIYESDQR